MTTSVTNVSPYRDTFLGAIDKADQYWIDRDTAGSIQSGFPLYDHNNDGLQPGFTIFAGGPNVGKTAFMMQMAMQTARINEDIYVVYYTLDDGMFTVVPRAAANLGGLPINAVKFPTVYQERDSRTLQLRASGLQQLRELAPRFAIVSENELPGGSDVESLKESISSLIEQLGNTQLVVFIDNFHDITCMHTPDTNAKFEYISGQLKSFANNNFVPMLCTAEMRKHGLKRPNTSEDIRNSNKAAYDADTIVHCFNEVSIRGEQAKVFFGDSTLPPEEQFKRQILEVSFTKNKLSGFKGRLFYHFFHEMARLHECTSEMMVYYNNLIK